MSREVDALFYIDAENMFLWSELVSARKGWNHDDQRTCVWVSLRGRKDEIRLDITWIGFVKKAQGIEVGAERADEG